MTWFDALALARLRFAVTASFHIIFPASTIGLASYLAVLNAMALATGRAVYLELFDHWKKIFAVAFGMGVVSGIVMSYQIGTNWSVWADRTGPVLGPLMGYEVLSAFWILAVNSWMQTPAGDAVNEAGQFVATDWWAVIFNPSFPYRLVHMLLAAYLTTAFVVGAVGALHLLRGARREAPRVMFTMAMWTAAIVAPLQILAGDMHGLTTLEHQPAKVAAVEGHFETHAGAPLILFGIPNAAAGRVDYAVQVPLLGSMILTHHWDGVVRGLNEWPPEQHPPVGIVFWAFRIMVGIGFAMLGIGVWSLWLRCRRRLFEARSMHRAALLIGPSGFVAVLAGWIVTEVGRQPYSVYGLLTTTQSASMVDAAAVGASLLAFIAVGFTLSGAGTFYILRLMNAAPKAHGDDLPPEEPIRAAGIMPAPVMAARDTLPAGE